MLTNFYKSFGLWEGYKLYLKILTGCIIRDLKNITDSYIIIQFTVPVTIINAIDWNLILVPQVHHWWENHRVPDGPEYQVYSFFWTKPQSSPFWSNLRRTYQAFAQCLNFLVFWPRPHKLCLFCWFPWEGFWLSQLPPGEWETSLQVLHQVYTCDCISSGNKVSRSYWSLLLPPHCFVCGNSVCFICPTAPARPCPTPPYCPGSCTAGSNSSG